MTRRTASLEPGWFDALYAADPDPWRFASSPYEAEKYAATLAALPDRRSAAGLEIGCSIGVLTAQLAARCDTLLALDVAEAALAVARAACPGVRFERRRIPEEWPEQHHDLIVLSEVLYYLDPPAIGRAAARLRQTLRPGGCALLVHFLGETDYPCTGDEAASRFIEGAGFPVGFSSRQPGYRIDRLDRPG